MQFVPDGGDKSSLLSSPTHILKDARHVTQLKAIHHVLPGCQQPQSPAAVHRLICRTWFILARVPITLQQQVALCITAPHSLGLKQLLQLQQLAKCGSCSYYKPTFSRTHIIKQTVIGLWGRYIAYSLVKNCCFYLHVNPLPHRTQFRRHILIPVQGCAHSTVANLSVAHFLQAFKQQGRQNKSLSCVMYSTVKQAKPLEKERKKKRKTATICSGEKGDKTQPAPLNLWYRAN